MSRRSVLTERLSKVQQAINGTLDRGVAAYSISGRSITSFSLDELMNLEKQTQNELNRVRRGGFLQRGGFGRA